MEEVSAPKRRRRTTVDNFFDGDAPHFIKVILEDGLRNKILRIPRLFVERHGTALFDPVRLVVPTGRVWEVGLCQDDEGLYLRDGWDGFMEDCRVGLGYLLLFRCDGDSRFFVVVFDITTCEIEYPGRRDVGMRTGSAITRRVSPPRTREVVEKVVKIEELDNDDGLGECAKGGRKKPRLCSNLPSKMLRTGQRGMNIPTSVSNCSLREGQGRRETKRKIVPTDASNRSAREARPEASANETLQTPTNAVRGTDAIIDLTIRYPSETWPQTSTNHSHRLRRAAEFGGKVAADEKSEAFLRASSFLCENTACAVRIRCLGCLHISKKFLMACFPGRKEFGDIVCVSERKSWTLGINKSHCPRFRHGWTRFVADNNLRVGDACVFELMEKAESKFRVVIFHENCAPIPCLSPPKQKLPCKETSTEKSASNMGSRWFNDSAQAECTDEGIEGPPFFTMVISKTSARHSVHVPATFARSHLPAIQAAENVQAALEYRGLSWPVTLYSRECCGSVYTMIKGWQKFRKGNGFQLGHELLFELIDKNDLVFRVSVSNDAEDQDCWDG